MAEKAMMEELLQDAHSEMDGKYLTFLTDGQLFGVPIADVVQIVGIQQITEVPEFPHYAKGIINLRGSIIPVIDMCLRLNKPERPYDERTCIIVTLINETAIGFIVDAVDAVTDISEELISPPPSISKESASEYLTGIARTESGIVLLLSTQRILSEGVVTALTQSQIEAAI